MMKIQFLAIGELLADIVTQGYCATLAEAKNFEIFQGGSPSNVALNLKWLGKEAELVACVGNDGIGKFLISEVQKAGLSGKYIRTTDAYPTSIVLVTKSKKTPDFIAYRHADTQIQSIDKEIIASSQILHTTAFALSKSPARENILHSFKAAKQLNKIISVDWNFAPVLWGNDDGKEVFEQVMSLQPLLKISMDDIYRFAGIKDTEPAMKYLDRYKATICLTAGKDGVFYKTKDVSWKHVPAFTVHEVKDTTGAGDAFWAGFLSAFIDKSNIEDCAKAGLKIASEKIKKQGPLYMQ